jgi:hypothetical protein
VESNNGTKHGCSTTAFRTKFGPLSGIEIFLRARSLLIFLIFRAITRRNLATRHLASGLRLQKGKTDWTTKGLDVLVNE